MFYQLGGPMCPASFSVTWEATSASLLLSLPSLLCGGLAFRFLPSSLWKESDAEARIPKGILRKISGQYFEWLTLPT